MALSLGVGLSMPAKAQTVLSTSQTSTVNLGNYGAVHNFSITSGTTIAVSAGMGVYGSAAGPWTLSNAGSVLAPGSVGLFLRGLGEITNTGLISGNQAGIQLNAGGDVLNQGSINGTRYGVVANNFGATVTNDGHITAGYDGISLNHGGVVVNNAGGTIFGNHIGIYTGKSLGFVENAGFVGAATGDAISIYNGGTLTNTASGVVNGGYAGVYAGGTHALVSNAGTIMSGRFGAYLAGGASLNNSGTILGAQFGVIDVTAGGAVGNSGLISASSTGLGFVHAGSLDNTGTILGGVTGVNLPHGGVITNEAGAVIAGGSIGIAGTALTLISAGTINAPTAIALSGTLPSFLNFTTGSDVAGVIDGGGTDSQIALSGTGALTGDMQNFGTGAALSIAAGADWTAGGNWDIAEVTNSGTFEPGVPGAPLNLTGNFTEMPSGTLLVVVTPTDATSFNVSGTASLAGQVVYRFAPGTYTPHSVAFIAAAGGTTGDFATVSYEGVLTAPVAHSEPAAPAAQTVQQATPATPVAAAVTVAAQPVALAVVSASVTQLAVTQSFSVAPHDVALFANAAQVNMAAAGAADDTLLRHADGQSEACLAPRITAAAAACAHGGWVEATGTSVQADGHAGIAGMMTGIDRQYGKIRLGFAIGYDSAALHDQAGSKASASTTRIGAYGAADLGPVRLSAVLNGGFGTNSTRRETGSGLATAQFGGTVLSGVLQLAAPFGAAGWDITPAAGLRITSLTTGHFAESVPQSAFALHGAAGRATSVRPYLMVNVSRHFATARQLQITPQLGLGYAQELGSRGFAQTVSTTDNTSFTATTTRAASPGAVLLKAGVTAGQGNWQLFARYSASVAGAVTVQTGEAGLLVKF
jgi:hypothetical protein